MELAKLKPGEVRRVASCDLIVGTGAWAYATGHREAILAEFDEQKRAHPGYFNGEIQILLDHRLEGDRFVGHFARSDFASFVYWRAHGHQDETVRDCFGCAVVRSREGHIVLGVQAGGNLNSGRAYFPSGFIDPADVGADGRIDIDGSILREIVEETGVRAEALTRKSGYILVAAGMSIAIAAEYVSQLSAAALRAQMTANLAREEAPELVEILTVGNLADIAGRPTTPHVEPLLRALL